MRKPAINWQTFLVEYLDIIGCFKSAYCEEFSRNFGKFEKEIGQKLAISERIQLIFDIFN